MSRSLLLLLCATACGGGAKKPADLPVLPPDPSTASSKPEPALDQTSVKSEPPPKPAEPPKPADIALAMGETTVKLVDAGKGKKAKLAYAPKADAKEHVEVAMDFRARQDAEDDISPTLVLAGDAIARGAATGSSDVLLTVSTATAKDVPGSQLPAAKLQPALGSLVGMAISSNVGGNGLNKEVILHIEKPDTMTGSALQLLGLAWPAWTALPTDPIGVGAKWDATTKMRFAGKLEITRVTSYELTAHTGESWSLKETTTVSGVDQDLDGTKATEIAGTGSGQLTIADGAIYPSGATKAETHFTIADASGKKTVLTIEAGATITRK